MGQYPFPLALHPYEPNLAYSPLPPLPAWPQDPPSFRREDPKERRSSLATPSPIVRAREERGAMTARTEINK